jgi:hypothetical protein
VAQVVRVYDTVGKTYLAMKIIKNKRAFHEQAQVEIQMLTLFKNFGEVCAVHALSFISRSVMLFNTC